MIFGENQVRQFYVLNGVSDTEALGNAKGYVKNGKFYAKYCGPDGSGNFAPITTDIVDVKNIRDIRITKPQAIKLRKWEIEFESTYNGGKPVTGEDYLLYFQIKNALGFGDVERFYKNIVVHAASDNKQTFIATLKKQMEKMLHNDKLMGSLIEIDTTNSTNEKLVLKEKMPVFNRILRYYPNQAQIFINESKNITAAGATTTSYWTKASDYDETKGIKPTEQSTQPTNGYVIAAMEDFFLRGRADMYGYNCTYCANPSDVVADASKDYFVLDIKYYYQEDGMNNQNSEKEMSFACESAQKLNQLISDLGVEVNNSYEWEDQYFTYAYIHDEDTWRKYHWMLGDYIKAQHDGGTNPAPNENEWNQDGWVVMNYKKPLIHKDVKGSYNGASPAKTYRSDTAATSSFIIVSTTDPEDEIGVTNLDDFDKSKLVVTVTDHA